MNTNIMLRKFFCNTREFFFIFKVAHKIFYYSCWILFCRNRF